MRKISKSDAARRHIFTVRSPHTDGDVCEHLPSASAGWFTEGTTGYFDVGFEQGQGLFSSANIRGHGFLPVTGPKVILDGDFNGAMDNFQLTEYGSEHYLRC